MSDSSKEVMEATNNFFEARVAVLGYKCRVLQLEGLLEASREENRKLEEEVKRLTGQFEDRNAGHYRPEVSAVACDGITPSSELEESMLPAPIFFPNQPMPMPAYSGYAYDVQRDSAGIRRDQPFNDGGYAKQQQSSVPPATYPHSRPRQEVIGSSFPVSQPQWNGRNDQVIEPCPICGQNCFRTLPELQSHSARCTNFR